MIRLILFASLCWSLAAHAEVYKWVDKDGNVHFTDQKPEADKNAEIVDTGATVLSDSQAQAAGQRDELLRRAASTAQDARAEIEEQRSEQSVKDKKLREKRAENCAIARKNLANSEPYQRMYTTDEEGNRTYLDDNEQLAKAEASRKAIAENCH